MRLKTTVLAVEGSSDPHRYARVAGQRNREAAVNWIVFPGFAAFRDLPASHELLIPIRVTVPQGAAPGTHGIGLAVSWTVSPIGVDATQAPASRVRLDPTLLSVLVIRVPGRTTPEARLRDIHGPTVVWGGQQPTFRAQVKNVGNTDLTIDAQVDLEAFFTSAGRTLDASGPAKGQPTLPHGVRDVRMRWPDPPLLGWFRPRLVVVGGPGSGVRITKALPVVFVLPPWWMIPLLVVALTLPWLLRRRRRRRPEWRELDRVRRARRVEDRLRMQQAKERAARARGPKRR